MKHTTQTAIPAVLRTWAFTVTYRECGVVTDVREYTVTLDRRSGPLQAEVNCSAATLENAVRLLRAADHPPVVLHQILAEVAA